MNNPFQDITILHHNNSQKALKQLLIDKPVLGKSLTNMKNRLSAKVSPERGLVSCASGGDIIRQHPSSTTDDPATKSKFQKLKPLQNANKTNWDCNPISKADRAQRLNLLVRIKSIDKEYSHNGQTITETICDNIFHVLQTLATQSSLYGKEMNQFFQILKAMIFCEDEVIVSAIEDQNTHENKPFNILVSRVLSQKYEQLRQKEKQIQQEIEQINHKILMIEDRNMRKLDIVKLQYDNNVIAVKENYQKTINQINSKVDQLKELVQQKQVKIAKLEKSNTDLNGEIIKLKEQLPQGASKNTSRNVGGLGFS